MQQGDKLTAITLTEENGDQDFDDWDDVGLNIPKPPDLLYLFRNFSTFMLSDREKLERIKNLVCYNYRGQVKYVSRTTEVIFTPPTMLFSEDLNFDQWCVKLILLYTRFPIFFQTFYN